MQYLNKILKFIKMYCKVKSHSFCHIFPYMLLRSHNIFYLKLYNISGYYFLKFCRLQVLEPRV
jgi:hypothetical protein